MKTVSIIACDELSVSAAGFAGFTTFSMLEGFLVLVLTNFSGRGDEPVLLLDGGWVTGEYISLAVRVILEVIMHVHVQVYLKQILRSK